MQRRNVIASLGAGLAAVGLGRRAWGADAAPKGGAQPGGILVPTRMFLATGVGEHVRQARADDLCLLAAGIGNCNRVEVSSIVPPGCQMISREEGEKYLKDGQVAFVVLGKPRSDEPGTKVASAIAVAVPEDGGTGCVAESRRESETASAAEALRSCTASALGMLATRLGVEFDHEKEYQEGKTSYTIAGKKIRVHSISVEATVPPSGNYVYALSTLVFLF